MQMTALLHMMTKIDVVNTDLLSKFNFIHQLGWIDLCLFYEKIKQITQNWIFFIFLKIKSEKNLKRTKYSENISPKSKEDQLGMSYITMVANEHNFSDRFVAFSGDKASISLLLCETMVINAAELNHMQDLFCNLYNRICHFECISIVIVRSYAHKEKTILSFKQRFGFTPYATKHILCDIWKSVWDHNNADN